MRKAVADGLDFFVDPHDADQLAGASGGELFWILRRVHTGLSGGGPPLGFASIGADAAVLHDRMNRPSRGED